MLGFHHQISMNTVRKQQSLLLGQIMVVSIAVVGRLTTGVRKIKENLIQKVCRMYRCFLRIA